MKNVCVFFVVVGVGVPDDPLPVYHSAKLTPSSTAFTSISPS